MVIGSLGLLFRSLAGFTELLESHFEEILVWSKLDIPRSDNLLIV